MDVRTARSIRFGDFELDVRAGELRKHGVRIRLQEQSFQILLMLLDRPGEVVLREEIQKNLWPNNTIVEFDHSINAAIKRLRNALGESAEDPRFIETLAKRGYRFVGEVESVNGLARLATSKYRILDKLGEGGMGIVYRAEDTTLGRQVALKFLPAELASDPVARHRFEREARAASALNHPGICAIYGFEEVDAQPAISMELVDGETLEARLARGPIPVEQVQVLARQICGALAEAHRKGIIHRDLKPANIMITGKSGWGVKILDFGIARIEGDAPGLTRTGLVAGTLKYMSPEQAEGKPADARSDIYSFGAVVNEMFADKRNQSPGDQDPFTRIVHRCIETSPDERWQSSQDLKVALEWIKAPQPAATYVRAPWRWVSVAILAVVAVVGWMRRPESIASRDLSITILPPTGKELVPVGGLSVERISPDGSMVLFQSLDRRFYVRRLNSFESELLPEFVWAGDPCWSPDSQSIAFPVLGGKLMKLRVPKGAPELIAQDVKGGARGMSWSEQGVILMAQDSAGLFYAPATGGAALPVDVPTLKGGAYYGAQFLPGSEDFIFAFHPRDRDFEGAEVYIATLRSGKALDLRLLFASDTAAAFTPAGGGRLLYVRNNNLYSQILDRKTRKLSGNPELVQERVSSFAGFRTANFSVSLEGAVAWRSGTAVVSQITVFDRKGNRIGIAGRPSAINNIRLSPDESRLIVVDENAWLVNATGPGQVGLHWPEGDSSPFWSDGAHLVFWRDNKVLERPLSDSGEVRELAAIPPRTSLMGVSATGRRLLLRDRSGLATWALDGKAGIERLVDERVDDAGLSPDGKWVTYRLFKEFGIYARPVSGSRVPVQLSEGGTGPVWRGDGREILYTDYLGIWSISVEGSGDSLRFTAPALLFRAAMAMGRASGTRGLEVSRDGSRIFYLQSPEQPDAGLIRVRTRAIR